MTTISELENRTNELIEQFENDKEHNVFEITGQVGSGKSTFLTQLGMKYVAENKNVDLLRCDVLTQPDKRDVECMVEYGISEQADFILIDEFVMDLPNRREFYKKLIDRVGSRKVIIARQAGGKLTLKPLSMDEN